MTAGGSLSMNTTQQQQQRSLHTQMPRSRNNSKEFIGTDKAIASSHFNSTSSSSAYVDGTGQPTPMLLLPESPSGRSNLNTGHRRRFNSRDMQQSYSNQYTTETNNLLPLERSHYILAQNVSFVVFFSTYLTLIAILQLLSASIMSTANNVSVSTGITLLDPLTQYLDVILSSSWTITNGLHCLLTILSLHWFKGSALIDEQGELNGMTIWEQLEATCESTTYMRRTFIIMPIVLAYIACLVNKFQPTTCTINLIFLSITMIAKLPQMNGVRLFGINRTAGIDDEFVSEDATSTTAPEYRDLNTVHLTMPALHPAAPTLPYAKRD
jgi:ORMDL family